MLLHALNASVRRGEAQTPELLEKVGVFKKENADEGTSRDAIAKERDDRKRDKAAAESAAAKEHPGKRAKFGEDELAIHAADSHAPVPASASGVLDLDATKAGDFGAIYQKKPIAMELDARKVTYKRNKDGKPTESMDILKGRLRDHHGGASKVPRLVRDYITGESAAPWNTKGT